MPRRYDQLKTLVRFIKPKTIVEVGTHRGHRAEMMCREALKYQSEVHYTGYDLFDEANEETNKAELNGKGVGSREEAERRLSALPGVKYEFVKGNTRKTLHGTEVRADFVFIDGGHSVETIRGDYEALKASRCIAFDDYITQGADLERFGCNVIVDKVPHHILPIADSGNGITSKVAVVGYDPKWTEAIDSIRQKNGLETLSFWRNGPVQSADLICCINTLERSLDPVADFAQLRKLIRNRMFFTIKADALRSLDWWKTTMDQHFKLLEWFVQGDEVVGTAKPIYEAGDLQSKGVWSDDERFANTKANISATPKRLRHVEKHDRTALIACYGPSLTDTWPDLAKRAIEDDGDVFSVSGAHDFLIEKGIRPKYHVECDPRPHKAKNLGNPQDGIEYVLASCVHPDLIAKLGGKDLTLWHLANGQESFRILEELEPDEFLVVGGGSAGLRSLAVAYTLGYRKFIIYGMDCSFREDEHWAGPHAGKRQAVVDARCGDRWFKTSGTLITYVNHFMDCLRASPDAEYHLVGDGLLQHWCQIILKENQAA